ncbi:ribonuclease H-like protein, partial [Suillus subluteus]
NMSLKMSEDMAANNGGLVLTMLKAIKTIPKNVPISIRLNSSKIIKDLSTNLENLENTGWLQYQNAPPIKVLVAEFRSRGAPTILQKWDNSLNQKAREEATALATSGLLKNQDDEISIKINRPFDLTGMKLKEGSQSLFYRGIRSTKTLKPRRDTKMKLTITIHAVQELNNSPPTPEQIWKSIRDKDIPRSIRGFLWKCLHNAYKIGDHWSKIPNFENRSKCALCGEEETMEHIIIKCNNSQARKVIWSLAEELWRKRETTWPNISLGTILGCGIINFKNDKGKSIDGKSRLFKILTTESAHLIWKLRCERAIKYEGNEEKYHSDYEIHNRWIRSMNTRLKFDKILTDSRKFKKGALKESIVLNTWSGVLRDEQNLPDSWTKKVGVLVGIAPRRPPGRN